jgi:hypothetical protein
MLRAESYVSMHAEFTYGEKYDSVVIVGSNQISNAETLNAGKNYGDADQKLAAEMFSCLKIDKIKPFSH